MSTFEQLFARILSGKSDKNIGFEELRKLLLFLGFNERIKGSHHIYAKNKIREIINLQPVGGEAKPYQVKQVRRIFISYRIKVNLYE